MKNHLILFSFLLAITPFCIEECKGELAFFLLSSNSYSQQHSNHRRIFNIPSKEQRKHHQKDNETRLSASQKQIYFNNINNQNKRKNKNENIHPFDEFITREKERFDKIKKFERKRMDRINDFLNSERDRLTQLEKQEKKSLSSLVDDGLVGDFASTLMRVDDHLQLSKRASTKPTSQVGWTKLILDPVAHRQTNTVRNRRPGSSTSSNYPYNDNHDDHDDHDIDEEFVFLYEPPSRDPSMIIMFLGGAGLGQFPHITYSELLSRISKRLNAAIITAPYNTGLDHYEIAKQTGVMLHRALAQCQQSGRYSATIPKFFLGHSLGSKLFTISTAAMNDILGKELAGVGLISFNNFGFIETTKQVRTFTENMNIPNSKQTTKLIDSLLEFAEQAVSLSGIEFCPSPKQTTERIIKEKYDALLTSKTRLFVFDDDDLDSSHDFYKAVQSPDLISISGLPGDHLSPNYIRFDLDDIDIPIEAQSLGIDRSATSLQSISYGDEGNLNVLVDEVCSWIMGQDPTRGPHWLQDRKSKDKDKLLMFS